MTPAEYDAWYDTPRGRWIGEREWALVRDALQLQALFEGRGCGHLWLRGGACGALHGAGPKQRDGQAWCWVRRLHWRTPVVAGGGLWKGVRAVHLVCRSWLCHLRVPI